MQLPGAFVVAGDERVVELGDRIRREVRDAAEMSPAAEAEHRVAEQLDPRQRDEVRAGLVEHVGDVLEVAGGLLDPDDVRVGAAQPPDGRRRDVDGGADGDVVDDDRQVGKLVGDASVPPEQALLLCPAVVGRDDERGGRAQALGFGGQLQRLGHQRGPGAGQERHPPGDRRRRRAHHRDPFLDGLRGRLAGRAADRDPVRSVRKLPVDQPRDRRQVQFAGVGERRDQRCDGAAHSARIGGERAAHRLSLSSRWARQLSYSP